MKQRIDFRLVILLLIAVLFMFSSLQRHEQSDISPVSIDGDIIHFDYENVFNMTNTINLPDEEDCLPGPSAPFLLPGL